MLTTMNTMNVHVLPTVGLSFRSNTSLYQKLVSAEPQTAGYWFDRCFGIVVMSSDRQK